MIRQSIRKTVNRWLQSQGIILRRVNYRVEVPQEPLAVQQFLLRRMGIEAPVIFDVGANLGRVTNRYRKMFPQAEIYSFEPFPALFKKLVERFAGDEHIHILPLAVCDRVGSADFHLTGYHATNSLLPRETTARRYYPKKTQSTGEKVSVKTTTLDAFCAEQGIGAIDILKFDIQGGEMLALQGAADVLGNMGIKIIFTESALIRHYQGEALLHEITDLLTEHHFSLYDLYHLFRGRNGQLRYCEAIFVSPTLRAEVLDTFEDEQ